MRSGPALLFNLSSPSILAGLASFTHGCLLSCHMCWSACCLPFLLLEGAQETEFALHYLQRCIWLCLTTPVLLAATYAVQLICSPPYLPCCSELVDIQLTSSKEQLTSLDKQTVIGHADA